LGRITIDDFVEYHYDCIYSKQKSKMIQTITLTLADFEGISESQGNRLVGGFSKTFSVQEIAANELASNNCKGGNCAILCGSNVGCNAVEGCGATK
jgi:hypothetical protein